MRWSVKKRAAKDHARKKAARKQLKHLLCIKSKVDLRKMTLNSRGINAYSILET